MRPSRTFLEELLSTAAPRWAPSFLVSRPDPSLYPEPARGSVTFWGHACVYVDVGGFGIVTDPVFGSRYSPFHGRRIPVPPPEAYEQTDLILVSHAHHDHLQPRTLARFPRSAVILCPAPSERYARGLGPRVRIVGPGDEYSFRGGTVIAVPADHPGGRYSQRGLPDGRALGYVIRTPSLTIYYSGDTDYFPGLERIGAIYEPDLAVLNVNAHLRPFDAFRAARELGVSRVIPAHVGAYGGRAARRGRWFHEEFRRIAGPLALPLRVGGSVPLSAIAARPKHGRPRRWSHASCDFSAVGIPRFAEMGSGLFRGGKPSRAGLRYLRRRRIRTVVAFRRDDEERRIVEALGMAYFEIPLHAGWLGSTGPAEEEIDAFLALAEDPANRPLFFHGRRGRDRTGVMAALYRVRVERWSFEEAVQEMASFGTGRLDRDLFRPLREYRPEPARRAAAASDPA